MALRKEQVLLLACVGLAVLLWRGGAAGDWRAPMLTSTKLEYAPPSVPQAPLVAGAPATVSPRRWFREPSETQPLPPRELPFPDREPAPLLALPLEPGPDLLRADLLAIPGTVTADVVLQPTANAAEAAGGAQDPAAQGGDDKKARYAKIYDQVTVGGQTHYGILRVPGRDLFELEAATDHEGVVVHLLEFSLNREKLVQPEVTFGNDPRQPITKIRLADSLRNIVQRRVRAVPEGATYVQPRLELLDWLLGVAQQDGSVWTEALRQVDLLAQSSSGLVAERARARVLFHKGDLEAELATYQSVQATEGPAAAWRHEGLGNLKTRLGLLDQAEQELARAVQMQPTDARPHASQAALLQKLGRPKAAAAAAHRALAAAGGLVEPADRQRVLTIVVGGLLGVGDLEGAQQALLTLRLGEGQQALALSAFLRASIDYAAGNVASALDNFRSALAAGQGPAAQLGVAACQSRQGAWQDALAGFEAVAEQAPLLRHRALTGIALLHMRLGQYDQAMSQIDRALEANPQDVWALWLRARAQAALGQLGEALNSLAQVLRWRDDFVFAIADVGALRLRLCAEGDEQDQAQNALAAMRYSDRAVQLAALPDVRLHEQQALARFGAADLRGAGVAFASARDTAKDDPGRLFAQAGLALADYGQDHTAEARQQLERLQEGLAREHPMRQWATATLRMIDDHSQKEQLDDRFEREDLGSIWLPNFDGGLGPRLDAGQVVFRGASTKSGAEASVARANAVQKAGRFLAVSCKMQLGGKHAPDAFCGLRIQTGSGGQSSNPNAEFLAQVGARDGRLFWLVREGREEPLQAPRDAEPIGSSVHTLELRVVDRGENLLRLLVVVDGAVVQQKDLVLLRAVDQARVLETALVVLAQGRPGEVDVRFDDYHLERRKD